jgi:C-terminal processing protease CtpA/Prc
VANRLGSLIAAACLLAVACGSDGTTSGGNGPSGGSGGGGGGSSGSAGTGGGACQGPPAAPSADWCARLPRGVSSGSAAAEVELSRAHALVRFFGVADSYVAADAALVSALEAPATVAAPDLVAYADALGDAACAPALGADRVIGPAQVDLRGDVLWVSPGSGAVTYPSGAQAVVVDLRNLPDVPDLSGQLEAAVAPALASSVPRPHRTVRRHDGMTDEVFSPTNIYGNAVVTLEAPPIVATGQSELALALLTEAVMPPAAVELAAALRMAGRASLFGEDLRIEVAEARFLPIGSEGISARTSTLSDPSGSYPDAILADRREGEPACLVTSADDIPMQPDAAAIGTAERAIVREMEPFGTGHATPLTPGAARAALVIAHAAVSRFHGFLPSPNQLDARLLETLSLVDASGASPSRAQVRDALRRFGHVLADGHNFVFDLLNAPAGYFVATFELIDGEMVVRRSVTPGVNPGDAITSIGGVSAGEWFATELVRTSASSEGYRHDLAARQFTQMSGPTPFGLRSANGTTTTVTVTPQPAAALTAFGAGASTRSAGSLADLGAPELHYINLDGTVLGSTANFNSALAAAQSSAGLVLDMRGYPSGINQYEVAARIAKKEFSSPRFLTPQWEGPDAASTDVASFAVAPQSNPAYGGPVALLVGHKTVSAAENLSTMLVDAKRVTVVGRQSASTNGNITGLSLPASFWFLFTGMDVRHADGAPFNGIGIVADIVVDPTAQDFASGVDPELEAAIAWLKTQ